MIFYDFHHAVLGGVHSFVYELCDTVTMCPPAPTNVSQNEVTEILHLLLKDMFPGCHIPFKISHLNVASLNDVSLP